jgi:PAS domain S-box-containing protein
MTEKRENDRQVRILLIEDDLVDRIAFQRLIKNQYPNYRIEITESVSQARKKLEEMHVDIVISDFYLGDGTPFDILPILTKQKIPVVITTGSGDRNSAAQAIRQGAADFLVKDQNYNYLKALPGIIERVLAGGKYEPGHIPDTDKPVPAQPVSGYAGFNQAGEIGFQRLVTDQSELIARFRPDGTLLFVNEIFCNYFGKTRGDLIGKPFEIFLPDGSRQRLDGRVKELTSEYPKDNFELRILLHDNELLWLHITLRALFDDNRIPIEHQIVAYDVTARKDAEEALKESEKFLNNVVENMPDMIMVKDARDLRFVRFNKAGEELLGYTRVDLYGKSAYDFFSKDESDFFVKKDKEALATKHIIDIPEEKIQTRMQGERILHTKKIPILDEMGNPTFVMGISEDITEHKRNEKALNLARHKLALLNAVTFHDIQSAAFSLAAYPDLLKSVVVDEKGKLYLEKLVSANNKILNSLNFAKNYQDMGVQNPRWQAVSQVFLFAISHLDFLHIHHTSRLEGLHIYADPLFEKVLFHLMQNVLVHGVHATEVTLWYQEREDKLILVIEDNGTGIPPDEKNIIFDRGLGKNAGLGLFFVREVLSITDMTIEETGEYTKGARFEITVPKGNYQFIEKNAK